MTRNEFFDPVFLADILLRLRGFSTTDDGKMPSGLMGAAGSVVLLLYWFKKWNSGIYSARMKNTVMGDNKGGTHHSPWAWNFRLMRRPASEEKGERLVDTGLLVSMVDVQESLDAALQLFKPENLDEREGMGLKVNAWLRDKFTMFDGKPSLEMAKFAYTQLVAYVALSGISKMSMVLKGDYIVEVDRGAMEAP